MKCCTEATSTTTTTGPECCNKKCTMGHLLLWESKLRTGSVFLFGHAAFYFATHSHFTVLTLMSTVALLVMLAFAVHVYGKKFCAHYLGVDTPVPTYKAEEWTLTEERISVVAKILTQVINQFVSSVSQVFNFNPPSKSIKFAFFMFILASVGKVFSGTTLAYLVFLGAFTVPALLHHYREKISTTRTKVEQKITNTLASLFMRIAGAGDSRPKAHKS
ncbi:reticulon-2 [Pelomyxa schiedti]|nr:reticulon-2 [Pelomyxa schiedti]